MAKKKEAETKKIKIIKEIKSKIKVIGEEERDESELEKDVGSDRNDEITEMASGGEFKAPSIVLEASANEEANQGDIQEATRERQSFEKEEAQRERVYSTRGRQSRDSYESTYYAAGGGTGGATAPDLFRERETVTPRTGRQELRRGGAIERKEGGETIQRVEEKDERYQTGQQQRKRRYPWEV